jgi:hypothetical protein
LIVSRLAVRVFFGWQPIVRELTCYQLLVTCTSARVILILLIFSPERKWNSIEADEGSQKCIRSTPVRPHAAPPVPTTHPRQGLRLQRQHEYRGGSIYYVVLPCPPRKPRERHKEKLDLAAAGRHARRRSWSGRRPPRPSQPNFRHVWVGCRGSRLSLLRSQSLRLRPGGLGCWQARHQ